MRIPIYEADYQVPSGLPVGPSRTARAIGDLGETGQALAQRIVNQEAQLREKKKRISDTNFLADFELGLTSEHEKIIDEEKKKPDPDNYFGNWQTRFQKVAKARVDEIQDPELKAKANLVTKSFENSHLSQQKHFGNQLWLDTQKSRINRILDGYASRGEMDKGIDLIEQNKLDGIFHPTEADKVIEHFKKNISAAEALKVDRAIGADPAQATTDLLSGMYPNLTDQARNELTKKAEKAFEIEEARKKKEAQEKEKIAHDEEEKHLFGLLSTGKLTLADIQKTRFLKGDERNTWWERLEKRTKAEAEKPIKTNPLIYMKLREAIESGQYDRQTLLNSIGDASAKDLAEGDVEKLTEKIYKAADEVNDRAVKKTRDYFKSQLVPTRGLGIAESPEEWTDYYKATTALDQKLDAARKSGKPIEGDAIWEEGLKLLPQFQKSIADKMDRMRRENQEMIDSLRKSSQGKKEQPKEQYEKGKIYTNAEGKKAKYLGEGKWELIK